jgi:hypothetical protein
MPKVSNDSRVFRDYFSQPKTLKNQSPKALLPLVSKTMKAFAEAREHPDIQLSFAGKTVRMGNLDKKDLVVFVKFAKQVIKSHDVEEAQGDALLEDIQHVLDPYVQARDRLMPKTTQEWELTSLKDHILIKEKISLPQEEGPGAIDQAKKVIVNEIRERQIEAQKLEKKNPRNIALAVVGSIWGVVGTFAWLGGAIALMVVVGGPIGLGIGFGLALAFIITCVVVGVKLEEESEKPRSPSLPEQIEALKSLKNATSKPEFRNVFSALDVNKQNELANHTPSMQKFVRLYQTKVFLKSINEKIEALRNQPLDREKSKQLQVELSQFDQLSKKAAELSQQLGLEG